MSKIIYHNIKNEPFEIFGLYEPKGDGIFRRIPENVAVATSESVSHLHKLTSGGRIRFKTDSEEMFIRAKYGDTTPQNHSTGFLYHGFDIYLDGGREPRFLSTVVPSLKEEDEPIAVNLGMGIKEITINMPAFGTVYECEIGLLSGALLEKHTPYKHEKPVVFYGSSITHGACASRSGRIYPAQISRKYDLNFIDLGFSGNCKAEDAIVDYMCTLDMAAFVSDYDHNAPDFDYLKNTHFKMYEKIRAAHPNMPYFMITKPDFRFDENNMTRRAIIMESYLKAYNSGDRNVYFIDGSAFFNGRPVVDLTVDGCHPNDEGMARMADYIGDVIAKVMKL